MKHLILILALVISAPVQAHADTKHPITTWQSGDITLTSDMQQDSKSGVGTVIIMGYVNPAVIHRDGFVIRWLFEDNYQIIMNRDNTAGYYDFTGIEENEERLPRETFVCKILRHRNDHN